MSIGVVMITVSSLAGLNFLTSTPAAISLFPPLLIVIFSLEIVAGINVFCSKITVKVPTLFSSVRRKKKRK